PKRPSPPRLLAADQQAVVDTAGAVHGAVRGQHGHRGVAPRGTSQSLSLKNTQVPDAGLKELKGLASLQTFYLGDTQVTEVGLKELKELPSLQTLHLHRTKVTDVGVQETGEGRR